MVGTQIQVRPPGAGTKFSVKEKVGRMKGRVMRRWCAIVIVTALIGLTGCNPMTSSQQGHGVIFEKQPRIYKQEVYYQGRSIGRILDQKSGAGLVHKVTIQLAPENTDMACNNWVFYVDNGHLTAFKIAAFGNPLPKDANICGFSSKAALNWFWFKTLLTNRIYKAHQKADALTRRFG
jgi:hypothetical protein